MALGQLPYKHLITGMTTGALGWSYGVDVYDYNGNLKGSRTASILFAQGLVDLKKAVEQAVVDQMEADAGSRVNAISAMESQLSTGVVTFWKQD